MVLAPGQKRPLEQSFDRSGDGFGAAFDSRGTNLQSNNIGVKDSSQIEFGNGCFSKSVSPYICHDVMIHF